MWLWVTPNYTEPAFTPETGAGHAHRVGGGRAHRVGG
jgi:hypothetical protein